MGIVPKFLKKKGVIAMVALGLTVGGVLYTKHQIEDISSLKDPNAAQTYYKAFKVKMVHLDNLVPGYWYIISKDARNLGIPLVEHLTRAYDSWSDAKDELTRIQENISEKTKAQVYDKTGVDMNKLLVVYIEDAAKLTSLAHQQIEIYMTHGKYNPDGPMAKSQIEKLKSKMKKGVKDPQELIYLMQKAYDKAEKQWSKQYKDKIDKLSI